MKLKQIIQEELSRLFAEEITKYYKAYLYLSRVVKVSQK